MAVLTVAVVALLGLAVLSLAISYWLAFAAFAACLLVGAMLEQELRVVGRDRLSGVSVNAWLTGGRGRQPRR